MLGMQRTFLGAAGAASWIVFDNMGFPMWFQIATVALFVVLAVLVGKWQERAGVIIATLVLYGLAGITATAQVITQGADAMPPLPDVPKANVRQLYLPTATDEEIVDIERLASGSYVRNQITLFERDPESWPGHAGSSSLRLNDSIDPPLTMRAGQRQRFNPQLGVPLTADNAYNMTIFIRFPVEAFTQANIEVPRPWQITEDRTGRTLTYFNSVGDYAKGQGGLPDVEGAWFLSPTTIGAFRLSYTISGRAETTDAFPVNRSFTITVTP